MPRRLFFLYDVSYLVLIYGPSGICVGDGTIPGERNPQKCKTKNSTSICLV